MQPHNPFFSYHLLSRYSTFYFLCVMTLIGLTTGCGNSDPLQVDVSDFESFEISTLPTLSGLIALNKRAAEPVVALNALVFKEEATGDKYAGLTGEEAYNIYVEGLVDAQKDIGSRMIWAGRVQSQFLGSSDPAFESIALLEYATPQSFLSFMAEPGEAPDAREAGLLGQWNVLSATAEESGQAAVEVVLEVLPSMEELVAKTGLSAEKITELLATPTDDALYIVEMMNFSDGDGATYRPYQNALVDVSANYGGALVWRGVMDNFLIGDSYPKLDEMAVTTFHSAAAYLQALIDPKVLEAADAKAAGLNIHWAYTALAEDLGF